MEVTVHTRRNLLRATKSLQSTSKPLCCDPWKNGAHMDLYPYCDMLSLFEGIAIGMTCSLIAASRTLSFELRKASITARMAVGLILLSCPTAVFLPCRHLFHVGHAVCQHHARFHVSKQNLSKTLRLCKSTSTPCGIMSSRLGSSELERTRRSNKASVQCRRGRRRRLRGVCFARFGGTACVGR